MNDFGPVFTETWRRNPERMAFASARYKWVMRMLTGMDRVAEVGAADGTLSQIVRPRVGELKLYDLAPCGPEVLQFDIVRASLPDALYNAIYTVDVLEHIAPDDEQLALINIKQSLFFDGVFIAGVPSLESQAFANNWSREGHVNCRTGRQLKAAMQAHFHNVFLFTMNDEMVGTGTGDLAYYLFVLCCGPR